MDYLQKKYANYVLKPFLRRYLKKMRTYKYNDLNLKIYPSVFHPKYFFSTGVLIEFIEQLDLENKTFCEIGAGSGILSFIAHGKKAKVVCFDLNKIAVDGIIENFKNNFQPSASFKTYHSDLFDEIPPQQFDLLLINPPYFFKATNGHDSLAWNCGENGEYFSKLFNQLPDYCKSNSEVYMILAENCEIEKIRKLAQSWDFNMTIVEEKKIKWEKNFIFKLNLNGNAKRN